MAIQEQSALTERVHEILRSVLSADDLDVSPSTDLASAGFDSLACAEFSAAVERDLGIDLVDASLAGMKTTADLAALVERTAGVQRPIRPPYPSGMGRLQHVGKAVVGTFCRWWFSMEIAGARHVPRTGPAVLGMNHESFLDIPLAVVASPRPIRFMAKRELFANPRGARFFHVLGGFSVDREAFDLRAIETALEVIRRGEVLGMYPEGTRTPGTLLPFLPGAAWVALKTGSPLVPMAFSGTGAAMPTGAKFFKRVPIRIEFAPPIPVEREDDPLRRRARALELTQELRASIEGMWRP